jgi:predicted MFS family arabinose efflux permease
VAVATLLRQVVADRNHQKAFGLTALMMFSGFTVIPYITLYMQANAGLRGDQIPFIYLCGGVATLLTARLVGRLTDRRGKVPMFRLMAGASVLPLLGVTLSAGLPLAGVLAATTLMFACMSGRMIPGMALVTSAADPGARGTFMTINSSVQSAAMGLAALAGGHLIGRDAAGQLTGYWHAALLGAIGTAGALWLAPRLRLHGARPASH